MAATRAAEAGATEAELNAMFGWTEGSGEAAHYIRKASRAKLGEAGRRKLSPFPKPFPKPSRKSKILQCYQNYFSGVVGPPELDQRRHFKALAESAGRFGPLKTKGFIAALPHPLRLPRSSIP